MKKWRRIITDSEHLRRIITDSEQLTGVAPVCPDMATNHYIEDDDGAPFQEIDEIGIYVCCPGPHIECWSEHAASLVLAALNGADAEVCS
jgi:hypothetical protein